MALRVHWLVAPEAPPLPVDVLHARLETTVDFTIGPEPGDLEAVEVLVAGRPEARHLDAPRRLRALVIPWAGLPRGTRALLRERPGLAVHNLHHNADAAAELALALLLAAAKHVIPHDRRMRAHDWSGRFAGGGQVPLAGEVGVVLGFGAIGRRVARGMLGLGMDVRAVRRSEGAPAPSADDPVVLAGTPVESCVASFGVARVHEAVAGARVLVCCLPHTDESDGLVDAALLAALGADAVVVNVARGPIVDEDALHEALASGRLHGVGLDAWWRYPEDAAQATPTPPSRHPFHDSDRTVLSPHRGGDVRGAATEAKRMAALARLLDHANRGEPLPWRVDPGRGY